MILVTVGTHYQQFDRLVEGSDHLAAQLNENVIIQRGCSNYVPKYAEHFQWISNQQMETFTCEARVVISQASAGAIILTLKYSKPLVLVPRLKLFGENHDDHQQQLARTMARLGRVVSVNDPDDSNLGAAIELAVNRISPLIDPNQLQTALREQLTEWSGD